MENVFNNFHNENYVYEYLYPYPLADLFRRYRVSREPIDQLGYLLAAGEASLKFLSALSVSQGNWREDYEEKFKRLKLYAPSFGTWKQLLETFAPRPTEITGEDALQVELSNCIWLQDGNPSEFLKSVQILVEKRNEFVHANTITNSSAKNILESIIPHFRIAFKSLSFLANYPFVICEEVRRVRNPSCFEAIVRLCQGCNPIFSYEIWRLDDPIDPQVPLLLSPDLKKAYSLHPLMIVLNDERLDVPRCYFYSIRKGHTYWQTYELHQDNSCEGPEELVSEMDAFLNGEIKASCSELTFHSDIKPSWLKSFNKTSLDINFPLPSGYKLLGFVGKGRYGEVYKVLHTGLQEVRALKVMRDEVAQDVRMRKRFEVEAQALSRLRGKSAGIDLYEYAETNNGIPYLIMQFAEKGSLQEAMERWGALSWNDVLDIGIKCLSGLVVIHNNGILHRDIKLSNILLIEDNYYFCDFGVSKLLDLDQGLTLEGDAIGTIHYMAPESKEGVSDIRSDLYSLGICLVYLLSGKVVADPRKWLYQEYHGDQDFRNALLGLVEQIAENRPPSASAALERFKTIKKLVSDEANKQATKTASEKSEDDASAITVGSLLPNPRIRDNNTFRIWKSSDGTVFREIPAGEYLMGGTKYPDERPVHKVVFPKPFFMATVPVTNIQFRKFCGATHYRGEHENFLLHLRRDFFEKPWKDPNSPVVFVSWDDAKEYVLWRCEQDDLDYRLPTEAQWEYACRAGTRTVYPWGNSIDPRMLNTGQRHGYPTPVGTYPPNSWGLFDMLGNVWEWCEDVFDVIPNEESIFYRKCAELPPGNCINPVNTDPDYVISQRVKKGLRSGKGGSWYSDDYNCRPANRRGEYQDSCLRSYGFRIIVNNVPENEIEIIKNPL